MGNFTFKIKMRVLKEGDDVNEKIITYCSKLTAKVGSV